MGRVARWKVSGVEGWYHVYAKVAAYRGDYPLCKAAATRKLVDLVKHYAGLYFCEVAAFCVMGNHYHLVMRFDAERPVPREELERRARRMYPGRSFDLVTGLWTEEDWERYRERLFDLSEYMRNVQAAYGRWYNDTFGREGRFWSDRFKSSILGDMQAVLDCMLYVELNPVRAGLVERPEAWEGSSIYLRELGEDGWLMPIEAVMNLGSRRQALREYRERLYYRGSVPTKEGQAAISPEVLKAEEARGFTSRGMYRKRLRYWVDGLAVGSEAFILEQLGKLREARYYRRRKNPIPQLGGVHLSLRAQRSTS